MKQRNIFQGDINPKVNPTSHFIRPPKAAFFESCFACEGGL
jgi:hypothetical protein